MPRSADDPTQCPVDPNAPALTIEDPDVGRAGAVEPAEDFADESEAPEPPD